ncbi:hypothetical protein CDK46_21390 [Salmonella enterica subsp. enterica serovar Schwarzengrund]|nr:hypothetical protein [Salmonella enterica subsp. enterica serovar Schwarzengrund]
MTQIKTYRVEYEKVGMMHRVRIFGRMGEVVKSELPKEVILRDVSIPEGNVKMATSMVDGFIQRLENNGFMSEA